MANYIKKMNKEVERTTMYRYSWRNINYIYDGKSVNR